MIAPARTSHLLIIVLLLFAVAAIPSQVAAQSPRATTSVNVDREGDTIGDRITIRVTVTYPATSELVILSTALDLGLLEPAVPQVTARSLSGEERHLTFELQTRAFLVGLLQVQLPNLPLVDQSGTAFELELPSSTIEVISVLPPDLADVTPKPLKAAEQIDGAPTALEFIVGPIVAVATLLLLASIFIRRRRRPTIIATQPPPDPAIAALAELTAVGESDLLPARLDEFAQRIDAAIRRFLEARYHLPALNLTASELTHQLSAAGVPAGTVRQISTLCAQTDAVAYAGATPAVDRASRYLNLAHSIVQPLTPASTPFATPTASPTGSRWTRPSEIDDALDTTAKEREGADDAFRRP
jgi:hypothetical protein